MRRRILLRPSASRDLDDQADYLAARQNLEMGLRFYRAADQTFHLLARRPALGRRTEFQSPILAGVRVFPLKGFANHLVFYRPLRGGIEIIRVLHGARDIVKLFEE